MFQCTTLSRIRATAETKQKKEKEILSIGKNQEIFEELKKKKETKKPTRC